MPSLIEVKSFTYPGAFTRADEANLSVHSAPSFKNVTALAIDLSKTINQKLENDHYFVASKHEHSNSVLLARSRFFAAEEGKTAKIWIDFEQFFQVNQQPDFGPDKYSTDAAPWAVDGCGFDPNFSRAPYEKQIARRREKEELNSHKL